MLEDHQRVLHALGPGRTDVILPQHVQHTGLGQPGDVGHWVHGQRQHRQHVVGIGGAPYAHPLELQTEHQQQDGGQHEAGNGHEQRRYENDDSVRPFAPAQGGDGAQHQTGHHGDQRRHQTQPGRHAEGFTDHVADFAARLEGNAQVALKQVAQIIDKLLAQRLIQPVTRFQRGQRRRVDGFFAGKRAARNGVHGKKGDGRNDQNGQQRQ